MTSKATSCNSTLPKIKDVRIDTLFSRLGAIYGHLWLSLHQNERLLAFAKKEWFEGLQAFDTATVKEVLLKYREKHAYPPTLPQFIECCKSVKKRKEGFSFEARKGVKNSSDVAKKHLRAIREFLTK